MQLPLDGDQEVGSKGSEDSRSEVSRREAWLEPPRILLAEDDRQMAQLLAVCLREAGYEVVCCRDGVELAEHLGCHRESGSTRSCDLVVSDVRMPYLGAFAVLEGLGSYVGCPPVILITAFGDEGTHDRARELGVAAFFDKPFVVQDLVAKVMDLVPLQPVRGEDGLAE